MRNARPAWRRALVATAATATVAATMTAGPPALATPAKAPAPAGTTAAPDRHGPLAAVGAGETVVTLVTGDKVRLTPVAGRYATTTIPSTEGGRSPRFLTRATEDSVYVIPTDALAAVDSGRLDKELFNVTYLAANGYADADTLPVIVQYGAGHARASATAAAEALPASDPTVTLESINASALDVSADNAMQFWAAVRGSAPAAGPGARSLSGGITRVWLDQRVTVTLDQSVPRIGAPQAWTAGHDGTGVTVAVLDSGIDANHPDVAGKVVESRSFIPGVESANDGAGHGTHVAATIAGIGAGRNGRYKGVAPGADLMIGKVLNDSGSGAISGVIDGMEWAARGGADVINLSLGGGPTDGTDPASQAVNNLTAETDALFVIAAGNDGGPAHRIVTPGAADAALTVAAFTKTDGLAGFSSRGPRFGDGALKPDIAAPGVSIVAARAAGTTNPGSTPLDDLYTSMSGTSMASPHVAGAAAILAQQYPDWTPEQLKAALMSSAATGVRSVYEQGAGRVDVARADRQQVFATTPNADFGLVHGENVEPRSRQVTYRNLTDTPVSLTLTSSLRNALLRPVTGVLSAPSTVTVPAGGAETVSITAAPSGLEVGRYTGTLVATDATGQIRLTTPIGLVREPPRFALTVHTIGRDGQPTTPSGQDVIDVSGDQGYTGDHIPIEPGTVTTLLTAGTYSVAQLVEWVDEDSRHNHALLFAPEVTLTGNTEITLDARRATQFTVDTPKRSEPAPSAARDIAYHRSAALGQRYETTLKIDNTDRHWATPTEPVTTGSFRYSIAETRSYPEVTMTVPGRRDLALHPVLVRHAGQHVVTVDGHPDFRHFTGRRHLDVIDVGLGRSEDIAGRDLRGKLVLMSTDLAEGVLGPRCGVQVERVGPIRDAGAAGIVAHPGDGTGCTTPLVTVQETLTGAPKPTGIPIVSVSTREGAALRAELLRRPVTVHVEGTVESPYSYALSMFEDGQVPRSLHYVLRDRDLAQVDLQFPELTADPSLTTTSSTLYSLRRDQLERIGASIATPHVGLRTTQYVGPLSSDIVRQRFVSSTQVSEDGQRAVAVQQVRGTFEVFDRPARYGQRWLAEPLTPGAVPVEPDLAPLLDHENPQVSLKTLCTICTQGSTLIPMLILASTSNGLPQSDGATSGIGMEGALDYTYRLEKDGVEIPYAPLQGILPAFELPVEPGTYRLTADGEGNDVTWTFRSAGQATEDAARPGYWCIEEFNGLSQEPCRAEPVLFAGYDLRATVDSHNRVAAGRVHRFEVNVTQPQTLESPRVAGMRLWASTDDGEHWIPVPVKRLSNGRYLATAFYPPYRSTTGAVSLKVEAWDVAGNRVEQTTHRAFDLRDTTRHHNRLAAP